MFAVGFQPAKKSIFLGQALEQADHDHYLIAVSRALAEVDQIDAWLKANPTAKLKAPDATTPPSDITMSPYYTKWFNFQPIRPDMQKLKDRLSNPDSKTWTSITPEEHTTFGWVSVVDQIFSAFEADPKNLTAGRWQGGTRLPDPVETLTQTPQEESINVPIIGQLPPTIVGIPTKTVLIGGGAIIGIGILVAILS